MPDFYLFIIYNNKESGIGNLNFLHLASPLTMRNAAKFGARDAWSAFVQTKVQEQWITCEVVHPAAKPPLP